MIKQHGLEVIQSGALTLIEDRGRFAYTQVGITQSGVMDEYAYCLLNYLLGNTKNTNVLEITFGGLKLKSHVDTAIGVLGHVEFYIDDVPVPAFQTHYLHQGQTVFIKRIVSGQRAYFGVKNGFLVEKELGSTSTTLKENIGGLNGRKLLKGDVLACHKYPNSWQTRRLKKEYLPSYEVKELTLRVITGYQYDQFSREAKETFFNTAYTLTPQNDRMACKLEGEKIVSSTDGIISEGIAYGAIQIPQDGQPIILLKERQTIGGYPKIGTVLPLDCFALAQCRTGQKIGFKYITLKEAQQRMKEFYLLINSFN
jgi:biotin-dependent carboxylase-like uncharacterized protein